MRALLLVAVIAFGGVATDAAAQPSRAEPKSQSKALLYSLGGTLLPAAVAIPIWARGEELEETANIAATALFSAGILFGPGTGHLYGHNGRRFWHGALLRAVGGGAWIWGATEVDIFASDSENALPILAMLGGAAVIGVSMIYDIATVGRSVEQYNRGRGLSGLSLTPFCSSRTGASGLSISLRF